MLKSLKISNFAIIDRLEIDFEKGFTTITGETGAGKSIMMGALSLILGGKADLKAIRNAERKSVIEATFGIEEYGLKPLFEANDIDYDDEECIMRREIAANGRSRAFINDTPVTLQAMRDITMRLVDIHSQHSNLLLSQSDYQLGILDSIVEDKSVPERYTAEYERYTRMCSRLNHLKAENRRHKEEEDYIRFQLDRLQELKLTEGEDVELEAEERKLSNVAEIKGALWESEELLSGEGRSVIADVSQMRQRMSRIAEVYADATEIAERMESMLIDLKDINRTIATMQSGLVDNPEELVRVQERLNAIYALETKHKVGSADELIALQRGFEAQLAEIDNSDEEIVALEREVAEQREIVEELASRMHEMRLKAADTFCCELLREATPLGMKNLQFKIEFSTVPLCAAGTDAVQFLFSFNKQQALMPVASSASGGEISRLMLCVKSIISISMKLPTIIFDEVDTGVSGDIANRMGELMRGIAKGIQVVTITHLPQVAVKGDNHYKVYKQDSADATFTSIRHLSAEERVREIAGMLSGEAIDDAALANARSLLGER